MISKCKWPEVFPVMSHGPGHAPFRAQTLRAFLLPAALGAPTILREDRK
jgi:hypothetical protein